MLTTNYFVQKIEELAEPTAQRAFLAEQVDALTDEVMQAIKARANYLRQSDFPKGVQMTELLSYAASLTKQPLHQALALMVEANLKVFQGDAHAAIKLYDEARDKACEAGNELEAARSQIGKMSALTHAGELHEAIAIGYSIKNIFLEHEQYLSASSVIKSQADAYYNLTDYHKSLELYDEALVVTEKLNASDGLLQTALILYNSAFCLTSLMRYDEALHRCEQALQICREQNNLTQSTITQLKIAECYFFTGNFNKALRLLLEIEPFFTQNGLVYWEESVKELLARCYLQLGNYAKAIILCRELLAKLDSRNLTVSISSAFISRTLGNALCFNGELEEAEIIYEQTREVWRSLTKVSSEVEVACDFWIAEIKLKQRKSDEAFNLAQTALEKTKNLKWQWLVSRIELLLASIALAKEDYQSTIEQAKLTLKDLQTARDSLLTYQARLLLAQAYRALEKTPDYLDKPRALIYYKQCLEELEHLRGQVAIENRNLFLDNKNEVFESLVEIYLEKSLEQQAFEMAERVKSRSLTELIAGDLDVRVRVRDEADRPLVEEYEQLREQYNIFSRKLAELENPLLSSANAKAKAPDEKEIEESRQAKLECERRLDAIIERLQVRNAAYAEDASLNLDFRFDSNTLPVQTVLVEYFVTHEQLRAFVVTHDKVVAISELGTVANLNRLLSLLRFNLANAAYQISSATPARRNSLLNTARALFQQLYRLLIAPLEPHLENYQNLLIVPHGPLHYLPFHALFDVNNNLHLIEKFQELSYLPSASLWQLCRQRSQQLQISKQPKSALIMSYTNGGALPFVNQESQTLTNLFGKNAEYRYFTEETATIANFKAEAKQHSLVHLATHAHFRPDAPLFSALLLADGELTARDFFNLELQASLLTLSACETGLGAVGGGDEVLGLSRACLYAGASSLLLSLWQVRDQSGSRLMQEFYTRLMAGETKAAALRQAQITLLHEPEFSHPFDWASFMLMGDSGLL